MGEIEPAHARAGPHGKRLGNQHAGLLLRRRAAPQRALLRVIGARRVTRRGPDAPILLMDQLFAAQLLAAPVTPLISHPLVQAFGKSFRQPVCKGLCHDRVVIVVRGPELVAQLLQTNPAGDCEGANVIAQPGLLRRNEVGQRPARFLPLPIGLLPQEANRVESPLRGCRPRTTPHRRPLRWRRRSRTRRAPSAASPSTMRSSSAFASAKIWRACSP